MQLEMLLKPYVLATAAFIFVAGAFGIRAVIKLSKKPPLPYVIEKPTRRDITQFVSATGNLKAKDQISIGSLVAGKIETILVDDNDVVKKGQTLATLDNGVGKSGVDQLSAQLEQAKAQLKYQQHFFKRQKALYDVGEVSDNQFDQITLQYELAVAKVDEIKAMLEIEEKKFKDLRVRAPEDGTVIAKSVDVGQMITSQFDAKILFQIAKDLKDMEVYSDVDEADVGLVKDGQEARFTVDAFPNRLFTTKVHRIQYFAKTVDSSITYAAVLRIANPNQELRPGMTANVEIKVAERKQVLSAPYSALRINGPQVEQYAKAHGMGCEKLPTDKHVGAKVESLWILENNAFKQIRVTFGARDGSYIEIKDGLNESQKIITRFLVVKDNADILKSMMGGGLGSK
jgi:HlyD family secretion protein